MTYPIESHKIYRSRSINRVIKRVYEEYKLIKNKTDNILIITNLDTKIEYKFIINTYKQ